MVCKPLLYYINPPLHAPSCGEWRFKLCISNTSSTIDASGPTTSLACPQSYMSFSSPMVLYLAILHGSKNFVINVSR